jgi:hypothetical protein
LTRFPPLAVAAAVLLSVSAATPAVGQTVDTAAQAPQASSTVNAVRYAPVDRSQAIQVVLYDASAEAGELADRLATLLRQDGWTVIAEDAPLHMGFVVTSDLSAMPGGNQGPVSLAARNEDKIDTQYSAHLRVYSSRQSSVIGGKAKGGEAGANTRVQLELTDARNGKRLWDGWTITSGGEATPMTAAAAVFPRLVSHIGETVRTGSLSAGRPDGDDAATGGR